MKLLLAADMAFNYYSAFPGDDAAKRALSDTAKYFREADFSVVNLENVFGEKENFTPIPKGGPNLISTADFSAYIDALAPTALGLANNHVYDFGKEALCYTRDYLKDKGYTVFGAGENIDEAYLPAVFEKDGVVVHVYAICENEVGCFATDKKAGGAGYSLTRVKKSIKESKTVGALPVIYFHGGNEHNPYPSPGKVEMYRNFVDLGCAAVVAMHTHCPQGYEIYEGAPIIYSMGNFYFPKPGLEDELLPTWSVGYMTMLDIKADSVGVEIIPYKFDSSAHTVLGGEEKERFIGYIEKLSRPLSDTKCLSEYFDSWCMLMGLGIKRGYALANIIEEFTLDAVNGFTLDKSKRLVKMKNVLGCEAHNELLVNAFEIVYRGEIEAASSKIDEILKLQRLEY